MAAACRNLIISPIGVESVHSSWLDQPAARSFDVFLVHYGQQPDFGRADADYYLERRGFKWELMAHVAREHQDILSRYDRIWCPDCDIRADTATINRLFELFERHSLELAQPAIAEGELTYQTLRPRPGVVLRYSPFVEVMCPLFTRGALYKVLHTFAESRSGWGLDVLWPRYFQKSEIAIIDGAAVEHTGRLGRGENYQKLNQLGLSPYDELQAVVRRHGGFNRRLHRRFMRGQIRLPAVWEAGTHFSLASRLWCRVARRPQLA